MNEINSVFDDVVIDFDGHDTKNNLLRLLEKKQSSMNVSAKCHEALTHTFQWRSKLVNYSSILLAGLSFILSTVMGENSSQINLPLAITSGAALVIKGSQQYCDFTEKAKAHAQSWITALDMADDIEYVILKNNHTVESLQRELDIYEERIKSFRKSEELIPLSIKHKFLPGQN